ncbi:MAG TPA: GAF domain-containing protein [Anaerolineales bacterium]|nr:GAF domain-containing protein [Anaerolineales bacterium]
MDQTAQTPPEETNFPEHLQQTSLGLKLTLIAVGLLLVAFIVYTFISIRISQGDLLASVEENLKIKNNETISLIQSRLTEAKGIATNLSVAVESGAFTEGDLRVIIQNTVDRNASIHGATVGYEPNQFKSNIYYWSPYYYRMPDNTIQYLQLGDYDYFNQEWYSVTKKNSAPTLLPPYRNKSHGETWISTWSIPIYNNQGDFKGVAAVEIDLSEIQQTFTSLKFGRTGYAFMIDSSGTILGIGDEGGNFEPMIDSMYVIANTNPASNWITLIDKMTNGEAGYVEVNDRNGDPMFVSYAPVGMDTDWSLALVYPREEVIQQTRRLQASLTAYSFGLALIFGLVIFFFTRTITNPLEQLTKVAEEISNGNLNISAPVESDDEVGTLAETINRMTAQLQDTYNNLERRITERTVDLEIARRQSEIRTTQLLSIGEISKIINSEQELDILLPLIARLVSERFNFYHVGIFLIDDARQYAVLQAANSSGGQNMLKRGHKLKVGESGIVGYVAKTGVPRIALDVGQDAVFFNNPDLPNTRSEVALPLKVRENIIGVLDVQSERPGAFSEDDTNIFNILADQVAITLENTRLFEQTQQALDEVRSAYQRNLQEGWKVFGQEEGIIGYQQSITGGKKLAKPVHLDEIQQAMHRGQVQEFHPDGKTGEPTLVVPIKLRDQIIGVMHIKAPSKERLWTQDETNLVEAVSERLSLALENARLIQESQRQVIKEQTITEITSRIGSSINLDNVLLTAVEELGRNIPGSEVTIKLKNENKNDGSE